MTVRALFCFLGFAFLAATGHAETRLALVIGVRDYDSRELAPLPNAINDARAVHDALQQHGFDSELLENPTRQRLRAKLSQMWDVRGADDADVVLIYFAGHGITFDTQGYLMARDSVIGGGTRPDDTGEVPVARLFEAAGKARQVILLLDACRTSPADSARLAFITDSAIRAGLPLQPRSGSIVSYSAEIGASAFDASGDSSNSPYAAAFLRYMGDSNLEIADLLKRVRTYVEHATDGMSGGPQRPPYEDRRAPGVTFYFGAQHARAAAASAEHPAGPVSPDALAPREAIGQLARVSGAQRAQQLRRLLAAPGIASPLSLDEAITLLGDIPADGGRRSGALGDLLRLLDLPLRTPAAEQLIDGLAGTSRYTALLYMSGCLARPIDDADAARLVEGIDAVQARSIISRLARPHREICGRGDRDR